MKAKLRRLIAWQLELRVQRLIREQKVKVVAITGSVGKTTTKLAIASVLKQKYRVLAHPGNYNSEIGLPMSIFELEVPGNLVNPLAWYKVFERIDKRLDKPFDYDVLVLEMGADQPGDIQKFMRYITPDVGVVTAIAPAHIEQFGSVEAIAHEKMALARGSKAVLLNAEDQRVMQEAEALNAPIQTYGVKKGSVHFEGIDRGKDLRLHGRLQLHNGEIAVKSQFIGKHSLGALAAAGAVGEELGLEPAEIRRGLETYEPVAGRMRMLKGLQGVTIIDDTYNSSPRATVAALETLMELPGRKIAVLGSMNELGNMAEAGHREVGKAAAKADMLVTIGDNANRFIVAGATEAGMKSELIHTHVSPYAAGEFLRGVVKPSDIILAKGSQNGVFAEEAGALLLTSPDDRSLLVRQSSAWQDRKRRQFTVQ
jgi:UDP-N-acetylmuramoyl-tripeptide--D-alanyl-D-alanine ligase